MATVNFYNHTARLILSGTLVEAGEYFVLLLDDSIAFDSAHTTLDEATDSGDGEVYGYGWPQGGVQLSNVAVTTTNTDGAKFTASNVFVAISGGDLGPFSAYLLYCGSLANDPPLAYVELTTPVTLYDGAYGIIPWDANGIFAASLA